MKAMRRHLRNFSWRDVEEHEIRKVYRLLCDSRRRRYAIIEILDKMNEQEAGDGDVCELSET